MQKLFPVYQITFKKNENTRNTAVIKKVKFLIKKYLHGRDLINSLRRLALKTMFAYKSIECLHQLLKSRHLFVILFH